MMRAGAAAERITPPLGAPLFEPRGAPAERVHSELWARTLAFEADGARACLLALDLIGLDAALLARVRRAVRARTGLTADALLVHCTHTHNAPPTLDCCGMGELRDRAWEAELAERAAAAVAAALARLEPARLAFGTAPLRIAVNRRLPLLSRTRLEANPAAGAAREVAALRVERADGGALALALHAAVHPVAVHAAAPVLSADVPGAAVAAVERALPGATALFLQGCAGDQNVVRWGEGEAAADEVGLELAAAALRAARGAEPLRADALRLRRATVRLPVETPSATAAERLPARAEEALAHLRTHGDEGELADARALLAWARRVRATVRAGGALEPLAVPLHGLALGELALVGIAHEPFLAYDAEVRARSPFGRTLVLGYTPVHGGYLPTEEALVLGGYEVVGAPRLFGSGRLRSGAEERLLRAAERLLRELGAAVAPPRGTGAR